MLDEQRDPDLELLRAHWDAPSPRAGLHARVRAAYRREVAAPAWTGWLAAFALAGAAALVLAVAPHSTPRRQFQPVAQPRFIVISQGEHP